MSGTDGLQPIKGKLLYFLLTDEYGLGESQCKIERLIQCAPIPRHDQRKAKQAIKEMKNDPTVPLYSKGGGERGVVQLVPNQIEEAKELINEWHPERFHGQSFDRTDLSTEEYRTVIFSTGYENKDSVWKTLEKADVSFDHAHGGETDEISSDRMVFQVKGLAENVTEVVDTLTDKTRGGIDEHQSTTETQRPTAAV